MFCGESQCPELRLGRAGVIVLRQPEPLEDDVIAVLMSQHVHGAAQSAMDPVIVCQGDAQLPAEDLELIGGGRGRVVDHEWNHEDGADTLTRHRGQLGGPRPAASHSMPTQSVCSSHEAQASMFCAIRVAQSVVRTAPQRASSYASLSPEFSAKAWKLCW